MRSVNTFGVVDGLLYSRHDGYTSHIFFCVQISKWIFKFATGPTVPPVAGSGPAEDGGFLCVINIRSTHFLRRGSKAVGPVS
jgi:hypothetical protein